MTVKNFNLKLFFYPYNRYSKFCSSVDKDELLTQFLSKSTKKKYLVTKRVFPSRNEHTPIVLECKDAASVIKKLNWENKQLFGPVQNAKTDTYHKKKIQDSNEIIQHQTLIPLVEPSVQATSAINDTKLNINVLLNFPLMNKVESNGKSQNKFDNNEMNLLRKRLENISQSLVPSVTLILEKTMPSESVERLKKWKNTKIEELGKDGFQKYQAELFSRGSLLHEYINSYLITASDSDLHIDKRNLGFWHSLKPIFPQITDVRLLEERVMHPFLRYKGNLDCFAKYKDHLVVIDWKTSAKTKSSLSSTFDNPLQIAAYVGALNFDPKFQYLVNKGLIVVAYESGAAASSLFIDEVKMSFYWAEWLKRVNTYWEMVLNKDSG